MRGSDRVSQNRLIASLIVSSTSIAVLTINSLASLIVARSLPHEEYGEVAYYLSTFLLISLLAGLGLTAQVTRIIAENKGGRDHDSIERAVGELLGLRVTSALLFLMPIGAWSLLSGQPAIFSCGMAAVFAIILDFFSGIFRGHQYYIELATNLLIQPLLYVALLLTARPQSSDGVLSALLLSFAISTGVALFLVRARRLLPRMQIVGWVYTRNQISVRSSAGNFYLLALTHAAYGAVGTFVLGRMGLFAAAALISIALTALRLLASLLSPPVASVYYPRVTWLLRSDQAEKAQRLFTQFLLPIVVIALGGAAILYYFGDILIPLLYTAEYREAVPLLRILAPAGALLAMDSLMTWTMVSHAKGHIAVRWYVIRILLLVFSGFTLQGTLGPDKAALSWSLAYLLTTIALFGYQLIAMAKHTGYSFSVPGILVLGVAVTFSAWGARSRLPNVPIASIDWLGNILIVCSITMALLVATTLWSGKSSSAVTSTIGRPREVTALIWLLLIAALLSVPQATYAAVETKCIPESGTSKPLIFNCVPGFASEHDVIEIWAGSHNAARGELPLDQLANDATWLYRRGGRDGEVALIVRFQTDGRHTIARVYDDQDGDRAVKHRISNGNLDVLEGSHFPTVTVATENGWATSDGRPNFNLDITIDGSVVATNEEYYLNNLKTDGVTDYEIHVRDTDRDGLPNYEWRQVYPGLPENDGFYHTLLHVNPYDNEADFEAGIGWPMLGNAADKDGYQKGYGSTSLPPIAVDWHRGQVSMIREFVASRGSPNNYFIYTIRRIRDGVLNQVDFESPFAFYYLGGPNPEFPDLSVRVAYAPEGSIRSDTPVEQVNLAWRMNDSSRYPAPSWDYGLALLGRNRHEGTVEFDEFSLAVTPYHRLPDWALNGRWDYGTFVAVEDGEYLTTEHIYEWATLEGVITDISTFSHVDSAEEIQREYVQGGTDAGIAHLYQEIGSGLRAEFAPAIDGKPYLYMSPVDNKLHLLGASHGVWNIDGEHIISYRNLDRDPYIDEWMHGLSSHSSQESQGPWASLDRDPNSIEALYAFGGHLIHSHEMGLTVVATEYRHALFETLPPADHDAWETQRTQLATIDIQRREPREMSAWLDAFPGERSEISGAVASKVRPAAGGFRFELSLEPGFRVNGPDLLGLARLAAGEYVVENKGGTFTIVPRIPAQLSLDLRLFSEEGGGSSAQVTVHNAGRADAPGLTLVAGATGEGGTVEEISRRPLNALAGVSKEVWIHVASPVGRVVILQVHIEDAEGQLLAMADPVEVAARPVNFDAIPGLWQIPFVLPVLVLFGAFLAWTSLLATVGHGEEPIA